MDIRKMMSQARKMQQQMDKAKQIFYNQEFEEEKAGVKIIMFGDKKIKSIDIHHALVDPEDKETLQQAIMLCLNEINNKINEAEKQLDPQHSGAMF